MQRKAQRRAYSTHVKIDWLEELEVPQDERWNYCNRVKECGHECDGVRDEPVCLPCLQPECAASSVAEALKRDIHVTLEDECGICFAALGVAPCLRVCTHHVFHASCIKVLIESRWTTKSITFSHLNCPTCKEQMRINVRTPIVGPLFAREVCLKQKVSQMAMKEARQLRTSARLQDPADQYYNNFEGLATASCTFYLCNMCEEPYFGGMFDC